MTYPQYVSEQQRPTGKDFETRLEALRRAFEQSAHAVRSCPDRQQGFDQASKLADELRDLADRAADLRAEAVARIWEAEKLSLAGLAQRIGVSKARADQLLRAGKTAKDKDTTTEKEVQDNV